MAEKGNDLKQRDGESENDYITRLQTEFDTLFIRHIIENEGKPLFASDIEDEKKREDWKINQLEQWNARHEILRRLVELGKLEREELFKEEEEGVCFFHRDPELNQR